MKNIIPHGCIATSINNTILREVFKKPVLCGSRTFTLINELNMHYILVQYKLFNSYLYIVYRLVM